jgi:hypothetical protein
MRGRELTMIGVLVLESVACAGSEGAGSTPSSADGGSGSVASTGVSSAISSGAATGTSGAGSIPGKVALSGDGSSGASGAGSSGGSTGASTGTTSGGSGGTSGGASGAASTAGAGGVSSGAPSGASAGQAEEGGACADPCPAPGAGITFGCEKRFLYGVNYAWKNWVADFGGVVAWGQAGVSGNQVAIKADLQDMSSHGVDVVRWWMLQQLAGEAVQFDATGTPTGTGGSLIADIQAALAIASQVGVHYNFTLFSFDDFVPSGNSSGATLHGMNPIVTDDTKRAALMKVVATVAQAVESSPNKDRVVSWDVVNEPEWAINGTDPYGDPAFAANAGYQAVTFAQMETFVGDTVKTLHANSSAGVTVGGAAIKWAQAWSHVGLDYYTFHMYDWVNQYYPYDKSLATYGVTGPTVLGEFPLAGLAAVNGQAAVPLSTMLTTLMSIGYAGAMPWAVNDTCCGSWANVKADVKAFADANACVTHF